MQTGQVRRFMHVETDHPVAICVHDHMHTTLFLRQPRAPVFFGGKRCNVNGLTPCRCVGFNEYHSLFRLAFEVCPRFALPRSGWSPLGRVMVLSPSPTGDKIH